MNSKLSQPHDKLFREIWSRRSDALAFLQHYLPKEVLSLISLDSLKIWALIIVSASL